MKTKPDISFWEQRRGKIRSHKGGWKTGQGVFLEGYSILDELVGKYSYMQVLILGVTGKLYKKELADWIEGVFICMSYPDSRIWCNHIATQAANVHASPVAALSAGLMGLDSRIYGTKPIVEGMSFIQNALALIKSGSTVSSVINQLAIFVSGKPKIMGYARPVAKGDERIIALEALREKLGFDQGDHLQLAFEIDSELSKEYDESINTNGYVAAFMSDQGFTGKEAYSLFSSVGAGGISACYVDQRGRTPGSFLPLRCEDIDYQGKPPRQLP